MNNDIDAQDMRTMGDYGVGCVIDKEDSVEIISRATEFVGIAMGFHKERM